MATRRQFLQDTSLAITGSLLLAPASAVITTASAAENSLLQRIVPATKEALPAIGMGTSSSFEVSTGGPEYQALKEVLRRFLDGGATLIDTAPTYGNAEDVLGALLAESGSRNRAFLATKLSAVNGRDAGLAQFKASLQRLRTDRVELLQVHNLVDWKTQIEVARQLKSEGKVKYVGVTHYVESAQDRLADVVQATKPDFLQINYSVTQRGAEKRVLPLAKDLGVAVLANRNFDDGGLFNRVNNKKLPGWAAAAGITSWAQLFLKFALSHDAVTAVIPATGKPDRQSDNLKAGIGPLLSADQKAELIRMVA